MKLKKASEMRKAVMDASVESAMADVVDAIVISVNNGCPGAMCTVRRTIAIEVERKLRDLGYKVETSGHSSGNVWLHVSGF